MPIRNRRLWIIIFCLFYAIANLPLILIFYVHKADIAIRIIGHAPGQFLFLLLFLPVILWSTFRAVEISLSIDQQFQFIGNTQVWKWLVNRRIIFISSIIIAIGIAFLDYKFTPPDFYQMEKEVCEKATKLNSEILAFEINKNVISTDHKDKQAIVKELKTIYQEGRIDNKLLIAEFLELSVVGFLVSYLMWTGYLNLNLSGLKHKDSKNYSENIRKYILTTIPFFVLSIVAYLFWPPFRQYNIYEIKLAIPEYQTLNPTYVYLLILVLSITLLWIYFAKVSQKSISTVLTLISFFASGALMGLVKLTPETMAEYIGSEMGYGNIIFLIFIFSVIYIFISALVPQIKSKIET